MFDDSVKVLLIADALGMRKSLRQKLEACGFNIAEACDAEDGLQIISDGYEPDVVLTDLLADEANAFTAAMRMIWEGPVNVVALDDMAQLVNDQEFFAETADQAMLHGAIMNLARLAG